MMTRKNRRGTQAMEFALTLPILMGLLAASIEYGMILTSQMAISQATKDATRMASTLNMSDDPVSEAESFTTTLLSEMSIDCGNTSTCAITAQVVEDYTVDGMTFDIIEVTSEVDYEPFFSGYVPVPAKIAHTVSMMWTGKDDL